MFFLDNIYRFAQAGYELSTLMNHIPSEDGYQPTLPSEVGRLHEQLASTEKSSITSIETVFVPSDDMTDYAVRSVMPYLDSMVVLSRDVYQSGRYPAIDINASSSTAMEPDLVGDKHLELYLESKRILEAANKLERLVSLIGESELSPEDRTTYRRSTLIRNYMTQNFFVVSNQTGKPGDFIRRDDLLTDMELILAGQLDDINPDDLLYVKSLPRK